MVDPLQFEERVLSNGVRVFHLPVDALFTTVLVRLPIGSGHNHDDAVPGSLHFLEHGLFLGSKLYPHGNDFQELIANFGGWVDGTIYPDNTTYTISVPNQYLDEVLPGFYSLIYEPLFDQSKLETEKTVIANERRGIERWYPETSEDDHYLQSQWMHTEPLTLRERLGLDEDYEKITTNYLHQLHRYYRIPGILVISAGGRRPGSLIQRLEAVVIDQHPPVFHQEKPYWVDSSYKETQLDDYSRYSYKWTTYIPEQISLAEQWQFKLVMEYLFDTPTSPIFSWLRDEMGWIYELPYSYELYPNGGYAISFTLPLSEYWQVAEARKQIHQKIYVALQDDEAIKRACKKYRNGSAYWFQRVDDVLYEALGRLVDSKRIYLMQEAVGFVDSAAEKGVLYSLWKKWVIDKPEYTGEILLKPKDAE